MFPRTPRRGRGQNPATEAIKGCLSPSFPEVLSNSGEVWVPVAEADGQYSSGSVIRLEFNPEIVLRLRFVLELGDMVNHNHSGKGDLGRRTEFWFFSGRGSQYPIRRRLSAWGGFMSRRAYHPVRWLVRSSSKHFILAKASTAFRSCCASSFSSSSSEITPKRAENSWFWLQIGHGDKRPQSGREIRAEITPRRFEEGILCFRPWFIRTNSFSRFWGWFLAF